MDKNAELLKLIKNRKLNAVQITMIRILIKTKGIDAALKMAREWPE